MENSRQKHGSMRAAMPHVTAFIDALREAFGAEMIDGQIRKGMRGEPVFHAEENGHRVGTPLPEMKTYPTLSERQAEERKRDA